MDRRAFITSFGAADSSRENEHASIGYSQTPSLERYSGPWDRQALYHLLRRTVVAPTLADVREAEMLSMEEVVDRLLSSAVPLPRSFPICERMPKDVGADLERRASRHQQHVLR